MKIAVKIIKIIILMMTAVWGIIFGIFAPLSIMQNEITDSPIIIVWLLNSVICYIPGTVVLMLGLHKTAAVFHTAGLITAIIVYAVFERLFAASPSGSPAALYMPVIFISILTIIVAFITNFQKLNERLAEREMKKYAPAPSILGGTTQTSEKPVIKKRRKEISSENGKRKGE